MKIIKKTVVVSTIAVGLMSLPAFAAPPSPNAMPEGNYTFSGPTTLTNGSISANCTLTLMGNVKNTTNPDGVYLDITGGNVTGSGILCGVISLSGFTSGQSGTPAMPGNWEGFISDADAQAALNQNPLGPGVIEVQGVTVSAPFVGSCNGDVTAKFFNGQSAIGDPSYFTFDDSFDDCSVTTTSPTGLVIQPAMSDNDDVNVQ